jgi:hypothetical protein
MSMVTAGTKHPTTDRYQVWLDESIRGISGNYTTVTGWYTLFDLGGEYDLIVGKNWHSITCHLVDADNVLHLLDEQRTADGQVAFLLKLSLKGLRLHQARYREVHNHYVALAQAASINLISAEATRQAMSKTSRDRIFVVDIRERAVGDEFGEDESILAGLGK